MLFLAVIGSAVGITFFQSYHGDTLKYLSSQRVELRNEIDSLEINLVGANRRIDDLEALQSNRQLYLRNDPF